MPIPVTVVGIGKIARDQHLPAIDADPEFTLAAAVSRSGTVEGVPNFTSIDAFLADGPPGAVALCTPPDVRLDMCLKAIAAGRDLLIEKPPAATLGEIETIAAAAEAAGTVLFATWHSRFAPGVAPARSWLSGRRIDSVAITWHEDVRRWHPGQAWIWQPGGFGVFDPGINALSILTEILPGPFHVQAAELTIPDNASTPIAAMLHLTADGSPTAVDLDWRQVGVQTWEVRVETEDCSLALTEGGAALAIDGARQDLQPANEYPAIYRRFARLIDTRTSDVDITPLRLLADASLKGRRIGTDAFHF